MQPILAIRHQVMQLLEEARTAKYVSHIPESRHTAKTHDFVCVFADGYGMPQRLY